MGEDFERGAEGGGAPRMFAGLDVTLYGELDLSSEVCGPTHGLYYSACHYHFDRGRTSFRN